MKLELHPYQLRAVEFMHHQPKAILALGMGIGKSISTLKYIQEAKPETVLIIAPKNVALTVWLQEADKWKLTDVHDKLIIVSGTPSKRQIALNDTSKPYKIIGRDNFKDYENYVCDLLVIDELTSAKNVLSKRTKAMLSIRAKRRIGLSGTVTSNSELDLYGQFRAVGLYENYNFWAWRATYFINVLARAKVNFEKWQLKKGVTLKDLLQPVMNNIITMSAEDYLDIPEVQYINHDIELTKPEMTEYMRLNTMLNANLNGEIVAIQAEAKFVKLQSICNGFLYDSEGRTVRSKYSTKIDNVVDFVERAVSENEQVFLLYNFQAEALMIADRLKKLKITFCSPSDKNFMQKWNDKEIQVLISHPASVGHGISLHKNNARIQVWSSITYSVELFLQANARLARMGQRNNVQIHTFLTIDTVEQKQYKSLMGKNELFEEFIQLTK